MKTLMLITLIAGLTGLAWAETPVETPAETPAETPIEKAAQRFVEGESKNAEQVSAEARAAR